MSEGFALFVAIFVGSVIGISLAIGLFFAFEFGGQSFESDQQNEPKSAAEEIMAKRYMAIICQENPAHELCDTGQ